MKKLLYTILIDGYADEIDNEGSSEKWWDSENGKLAIEIESTMDKPICSQYWDPKEHLRLMLNTFLVEQQIYKLYKDKMKWVNPDDHYYLHEGIGKCETDCITKDGYYAEIKAFKNSGALERWLEGSTGTFDKGHGCDLYLCYNIASKKLYIVNKDKSKCVLAKRQPTNINLV